MPVSDAIEPDVVVHAQSRYALELQVLEHFIDARSAGIAVVLAIVSALSASNALSNPELWVVVGVAVALSIVNGVVFARHTARIVPGLIALNDPPLTRDDDERRALEALPPRFLDPVSVATPAQLERMFVPTPEDARDASGDAAKWLARALVLNVLALMGVIAAGLIPITALVLFAQDGLAPWVVVTLFAGIPLAALLFVVDASTRGIRAIGASLVEVARPELPRLWNADPEFASGKVIVHTDHGYELNELALPFLGRLPRLRQLTIPTLLIALALIAGLSVLNMSLTA